MHINIYINKKIKDKNIKNATEEYLKRLSKYCKIKTINIKKKDNLESILRDSKYSILISNKEKSISSEDLAKNISSLNINGISELNIFIETDSNLIYDSSFCLTYLNFSEEIDYMILLEQIYRSYRIINNEPYHK